MTAATETKRVIISHKDHDHPSTSKARAECRAAIAEGKPVELKPEAKKAAPKKPARKAAPKAEATAPA